MAHKTVQNIFILTLFKLKRDTILVESSSKDINLLSTLVYRFFDKNDNAFEIRYSTKKKNWILFDSEINEESNKAEGWVSDEPLNIEFNPKHNELINFIDGLNENSVINGANTIMHRIAEIYIQNPNWTIPQEIRNQQIK